MSRPANLILGDALSMLAAAFLFCARLELRARALVARRGATEILIPPRGTRITLTRRYLTAPALVLTTDAFPDHAGALRDLHSKFMAATGVKYVPRRGDSLDVEVTA